VITTQERTAAAGGENLEAGRIPNANGAPGRTNAGKRQKTQARTVNGTRNGNAGGAGLQNGRKRERGRNAEVTKRSRNGNESDPNLRVRQCRTQVAGRQAGGRCR